MSVTDQIAAALVNAQAAADTGQPLTSRQYASALAPLVERIAKEVSIVTDLPDYSDAVKVLDEALAELQVVDDEDQAWSLLDYLAQQGWDLVRRDR